ncbi:hypothetical protein DAPPUDRAFT_112716 [Daphnia pulex]|uniref:Uncharacterized protein n=1 Tax=Daphnia pulex TaxID=6669 RepID=E9HCV5_DAPPU|nr:hypothetical protein DAPPUDRAFT_112716 [Daphnia pulex]|eukprot:EFX70456.1 hypothetical protein DAPPUDRAFT_112716 [Daphnia pulex]
MNRQPPLQYALVEQQHDFRLWGATCENWSGEATRGGVFRLDEQSVYVTIGDNAVVKKGVRKEDPIWMRESTVDNEAATSTNDNIAGPAIIDEMELPTLSTEKNRNQEDIMSVLMELEKPSDAELMDTDSEEEVSLVRVGNLEFPVQEVPAEQVTRMAASEKDAYVDLHFL